VTNWWKFVGVVLFLRLEPELDRETCSEHGSLCVVMPAPWDIRYYRQTSGRGSVITLVKKIPGGWAGVSSDDRIGRVDLKERQTFTNAQVGGVRYSAATAMSDAEKALVVARVDAAVANGSLIIFPRYGEPTSSWLGSGSQALLGMATIWFMGPGRLAQLIRWSLRSRYRFGSVILVFLLSRDVMYRMGFIDLITSYVDAALNYAGWCRTQLAEVSDAYHHAEESFRWYLEVISRFIDTQRLFLFLTAGIFLMICYVRSEGVWEAEADSPTSSGAPSRDSTPPVSPRGSTDIVHEEIIGLMKHSNKTINRFLPFFFNYLEPKTVWQERNPFQASSQ